MGLVSLAPFLNYQLCEDTPSLQEVIANEIQTLGLVMYKTDVSTITKLQRAENVYTRVPVLLHPLSKKEVGKSSRHFLDILRTKYPTAITIEGEPEELPTLIAEKKNTLNPWIEKSQNEIVQSVTRLVFENMHNADFSLVFIADKLKISRQSLQKTFHKAGLSRGIWEYVLDLRMHEAERVILESTLQLKEISAIFGYSEYDSFSKRFKQVLGIPPKEVRRA